MKELLENVINKVREICNKYNISFLGIEQNDRIFCREYRTSVLIVVDNFTKTSIYEEDLKKYYNYNCCKILEELIKKHKDNINFVSINAETIIQPARSNHRYWIRVNVMSVLPIDFLIDTQIEV